MNDTNRHLMERFFDALNRHDHRAMADCYDQNATFRDIAFHLHGKAEIGSMWRMIASGDIRVTYQILSADNSRGVAKSLDVYTFRSTGRTVRNAIQSQFRFLGGKIVEHRDSCDPVAWGQMALGGIPGFLAGRFRFLRSWKARQLLREFTRDPPSKDGAG